MSNRRRYAFLAVVALQALLPLALIGWNEVALARGTDVVLRTAPVDPVDLFRGRYVELRYDISSLPTNARMGTTVYVPLAKADGVWRGNRATTQRPADGVFIRGRVVGPDRIVYGIETYYADEDEAPRLEREAGDGLFVHVSIEPDGQARIDKVEVR
jgi:uncharacterized membrane-anchored protein